MFETIYRDDSKNITIIGNPKSFEVKILEQSTSYVVRPSHLADGSPTYIVGYETPRGLVRVGKMTRPVERWVQKSVRKILQQKFGKVNIGQAVDFITNTAEKFGNLEGFSNWVVSFLAPVSTVQYLQYHYGYCGDDKLKRIIYGGKERSQTVYWKNIVGLASSLLAGKDSLNPAVLEMTDFILNTQNVEYNAFSSEQFKEYDECSTLIGEIFVENKGSINVLFVEEKNDLPARISFGFSPVEYSDLPSFLNKPILFKDDPDDEFYHVVSFLKDLDEQVRDILEERGLKSYA